MLKTNRINYRTQVINSFVSKLNGNINAGIKDKNHQNGYSTMGWVIKLKLIFARWQKTIY
jgi:hypothetical protein